MRFVIILVILIDFLFFSRDTYAFDFNDLDMRFQASTSQTYDDNITFVKENEKEDFITKLSLGLDLKYEGKTQGLELIGRLNQQIFAKNHNFNNTSEDLTLNFQKEFSKYDRLSLGNTFSHTYEPRSFEEAFGRTGGRYSYYRNRFNLAYAKDISKQFSIGARYANEIDEITREDLRDSSLNRIGLDATYFPISTIILMFSYDFSRREFNPGSKASTNTITPSLRYYLTKQLYFDGKAGIDLINSYNDQNYTRPLIQVSLTNDIDENSHAGLSFAKRYYTNAYTQDLFNYWQTSAYFTRQLSERLGGSLSGFYGEGEYVSLGITDELQGVSLGFRYDLTKNTKVDFTYAYSTVNSTDVSREYVKNTAMLGLSVEF